ncbi:MAG: MdlB, multidrug/protein/lipid transporter ATPase, ATP-binding cassette, subfamily bacterial [Candidatus Saccharibacteria bacterium]|nr:MdlB, multidrug/protein/lipid transporter ATPase, ATP-binding cassette, subfamily bacterial [Candidatus Saccharibacteria bacterium]
MAKKQTDTIMQRKIIALFVHLAMQYRFKTLYALFGAAFTAIVGNFIGPFIISQLLESLQNGSLTLASATPLIILYTLTQIWGDVIGWRLNLYMTWRMEVAAQRDLYAKIFTQLTSQSLSFHGDRFGGALVSQTTKIIGAFEKFWDTLIFQVMPAIAGILAASIILGFVFWQYAVFLFSLSVIFAITVFFGSRFMAKRNLEEAQASTQSNAHVADTVTNVMTIKSYGHEKTELTTMNEKTEQWRQKSLRTMWGFLGVSTAYSSLLVIINVTALVAAILASEAGIASIGVVYLAVTYTFTVARQLWEMNNIMRNYNRIMGDAHDMTEILQLTPSVLDAAFASDLMVSKGVLDIKNMSFHHEDDQAQLFTNFSLEVPAGQKLGLVGQSGSGKTTLTKLILRFADIDTGVVSIDGVDISTVTQQSLRKSIAYVPQEPMLFHRSLRDNIAYGKIDASDAEIKEAAKQANALEFIEKQHRGFDTLVGERGVKLSGGQRQRIAIARAILKDSPILILDEATSALDSESEKLIQDALEKLMKGRTSIVIAHRLSTIAKLDRIIVLDNGTIVEDGIHANLLKQKGIYANLWNHQSGGFIEE